MTALFRTPQDFSLVQGGMVFQLLCRAHLCNDVLALLRRRIIALLLLAWLPLLLLTALEGNLLVGAAAVPFLKDVSIQVRLLAIMPVLLIAEPFVHLRMRPILQQFLERKLISESAMPRFEAAVDAAYRLRNSKIAEILILVFVYTVGVNVIWRQHVALDVVTWYSAPADSGSELSLAGQWYAWVSLPLFQFLLCRWYFRLFIWARFLWHMSRIEMQLIPTHPDRAGGLGFLAATASAFSVIAAAHGMLLAGSLAERIFYSGAALPQFIIDMAFMVVLVMCVIFGPLLLFAPQLMYAKRKGLREYGTLADRYVREFDAKWRGGPAPDHEPFLGSADIQSLADLANSHDIVRTMRPAPVTRRAALGLAASVLLPISPLILTEIPLEELIRKLVTMFV